MAQRPTAVHQEILIAAPPGRVFEAWVDPLEIARWYVERAEGDPREDQEIRWVLRGEVEPFEVNACEPGERLVLTHVGDPPWRGTVVSVTFEKERTGTRVTVRQRGFRPEMKGRIPQVSSAWACMLALLKEYLEEHAGMPRDHVEVRSEVDPNPLSVATALRSVESIEHWAEEPPDRILATTPHAAVFTLDGLPGVFTVSGVGAVSVWYSVWGGSDAEDAYGKAQQLVDRFVDRVQRVTRRVR
jgi:uncharacterized protein YndB with AHSA1/START domain